MSEPGGFAHLSLNQQADMLRSISIMVADRQTAFRRVELYALDTLFVELYFHKYRKITSVEKIRYINNMAGLQPYLDKIELPL